MSRAIDADLLGLTDMEIIMCNGDYKEALEMLINKIDNAPTIEPEIIRCKDCVKHEICRTTNIWAVAPDDNWFCADAERRTDETD